MLPPKGIRANKKNPLKAFLPTIPTYRRSVTRSFDLRCPVCRRGRVLPCLTNAANGCPGNHRWSSVPCPYYFDVVLHSKSIISAFLLCRGDPSSLAIRETPNPISVRSNAQRYRPERQRTFDLNRGPKNRVKTMNLLIKRGIVPRDRLTIHPMDQRFRGISSCFRQRRPLRGYFFVRKIQSRTAVRR